MIRSRLGLRAITLCLALAGLMAVGVGVFKIGVTQAETGAFWLVKGVKVTTLLPELTASLENNHAQLLGIVGGVGFHTLCTGLTLSGTHLLAEGGLLGTMLFSGCSILRLKEGKTEKLAGCTPPGGHITTSLLKGLIVLNEGNPVTALEPNSGTQLITISTGEECNFGEKIVINGKLVIQDAAFLTDQVTHLITEYPKTTELYLNGNKANKATVDGSVNVSLAGVAHAGLTWSGHAG